MITEQWELDEIKARFERAKSGLKYAQDNLDRATKVYKEAEHQLNCEHEMVSDGSSMAEMSETCKHCKSQHWF